MTPLYQVRADYDADSIVVYQAYPSAIADAALRHGRFVPPFSFQRMTWIKPSFRWLMHRSNWGRKSGQERTLAVRVSRAGWESALAAAVLTTGEPDRLRDAPVHVQWDPERSVRGAALNHYSIQVGLGRAVIREFVEEWTVDIRDLTPTVRKLAEQVHAGADVRRRLPPERVYPVPPEIGRPLLIEGGRTGR
ncbi:uncharacterized protein DUF4291 [Stackebrandtia albiflava]|uniref:Uncharacterized protein DUF4291 n=1 Tax=Stackebrandtia albiflava TaxID=406432 RepID=A0A562UQB9_9ACTN|nr:DUF4291 domain-containing protein [Stackebrandtia albiflava]TWJ07810.1 uncharacterized protein DUF4291 [Stackebrandtia albiflava]